MDQPSGAAAAAKAAETEPVHQAAKRLRTHRHAERAEYPFPAQPDGPGRNAVLQAVIKPAAHPGQQLRVRKRPPPDTSAVLQTVHAVGVVTDNPVAQRLHADPESFGNPAPAELAFHRQRNGPQAS